MDRPEDKFGDGKMDEFEEQLMRELRRVDAPEGFALRVLDLVSKQTPQRETIPHARAPRAGLWGMSLSYFSFSAGAWWSGAVAAVLVLGCFGTEYVHVKRQQKATLAQQQFETAMRVTDHVLDQTRAQLERNGFRLGN